MTNEELLQRMEDKIALRGLSPWTRREYIQKAQILIPYFFPKLLSEVSDSE